MLTTGSKWFFGLGLLSLVLAAAYGWTTGGSGLGPLTMGYHGSVGDHLGYTLLMSTALVAIFLGIVSVATRDADPGALAQLAGTDDAPAAVAPAHAAHWPILSGFAAGLLVLGLVISNVMFVAALLLLAAALVEWMVLAWSDRATGDPATNRLIRRRVMAPFEVPIGGAAIIALAVFAFSRLFLTSSKLGAVWVATGLAVVVLGIAAAIAAKPRVSPNVVAGVISICALGVLTAGVVAAARGERIIVPHETHTDEGDGLSAYYPDGTNTDAVATATTEAEERAGGDE